MCSHEYWRKMCAPFLQVFSGWENVFLRFRCVPMCNRWEHLWEYVRPSFWCVLAWNMRTKCWEVIQFQGCISLFKLCSNYRDVCQTLCCGCMTSFPMQIHPRFMRAKYLYRRGFLMVLCKKILVLKGSCKWVSIFLDYCAPLNKQLSEFCSTNSVSASQ